ncbi:MAG: SxtJ family membrane protein [Pelagibacteraceae bacterium]
MKKSSSKSFGYLFFGIFLALAVWVYVKNQNLNYWLIGTSTVFLVLTLIKSKLLDVLNDLWIKFGELLGKIIAPIIMSIVFFLIVTPIGLVLKIVKKDLLKLKFNNDKSYWIEKSKTIESMDKQF